MIRLSISVKHTTSTLIVCDKTVTVFFFFYFNYLFILFIYFRLHWVFVAAHGLSLVVASGGYSSLWCAGFSLRWLLIAECGL